MSFHWYIVYLILSISCREIGNGTFPLPVYMTLNSFPIFGFKIEVKLFLNNLDFYYVPPNLLDLQNVNQNKIICPLIPNIWYIDKPVKHYQLTWIKYRILWIHLFSEVKFSVLQDKNCKSVFADFTLKTRINNVYLCLNNKDVFI